MKMELNAQQFGFTICSHSRLVAVEYFLFPKETFFLRAKMLQKFAWENGVFIHPSYRETMEA
jgi:hypothetical protein